MSIATPSSGPPTRSKHTSMSNRLSFYKYHFGKRLLSGSNGRKTCPSASVGGQQGFMLKQKKVMKSLAQLVCIYRR